MKVYRKTITKDARIADEFIAEVISNMLVSGKWCNIKISDSYPVISGGVLCYTVTITADRK